jgi:hypothetical protein
MNVENWEQGRAASFKGTHKPDLLCSVVPGGVGGIPVDVGQAVLDSLHLLYLFCVRPFLRSTDSNE